MLTETLTKPKRRNKKLSDVDEENNRPTVVATADSNNVGVQYTYWWRRRRSWCTVRCWEGSGQWYA